MEIKTLIEVFEQLIPHYKKAVEKDSKLLELDRGICLAAMYLLNVNIHSLFLEGYYCNLINKSGYLFPIGKPGLKRRLKFLQEQVKELNNLLKQGYTHI